MRFSDLNADQQQIARTLYDQGTQARTRYNAEGVITVAPTATTDQALGDWAFARGFAYLTLDSEVEVDLPMDEKKRVELYCNGDDLVAVVIEYEPGHRPRIICRIALLAELSQPSISPDRLRQIGAVMIEAAKLIESLDS